MRLAVLSLILTFAGPASADLFDAAGRIEVGGGLGGCSAALIEADVVITAAHCVSEDEDKTYAFRLGNGADTEPIPVERVVIHPLYSDFEQQKMRRLRFDIAIAKLASPVDPEVAKGFPTGNEARTGEGLFMVSWRAGPRPKERRCLVIETKVPSVVTLGCSVRGGESGAPVLRLTDTGVELVAIINSTATYKGRSVAFAADARGRIEPLITRLKRGP